MMDRHTFIQTQTYIYIDPHTFICKAGIKVIYIES